MKAWLSGLFVVSAILITPACSSEPEGIHSALCEIPCYDGPEKTRLRGECRDGVPKCDATGRVVACENEKLPEPEYCNGLDDDCNGVVDDYVNDPTIMGACAPSNIYPFITEGKSTCRAGRIRCINAALTCTGVVAPVPETCDGLDNDCNGVVDDMSITGFCYDGDLETLARPNVVCHAGVQACQQGKTICLNQVLPTTEICDGVDNDCDGIIDNVNNGGDPGPVDIVLLIDRSGSMGSKIEALKLGLLDFLRAHDNDSFRFALVDVPSSAVSRFAAVSLDFVPANSATTAVSLLDASYGGTEPSWDALIESVDGTFELHWRPMATHITMFFGDEEGQTNTRNTEQDVARALHSRKMLFYGFVDPGTYSSYDDIAQATGGQIFNINSTADTLRQLIWTVLDSPCGL